MTKGRLRVLRGGMGALALLGLLWMGPGWVADAAGSMTMRQAEPSHAYNAQFTFTRLRYGQPQDFGFFGGRGREPQWAHDYPRSDRNFVSILEFLTNTHTRLIETNVLDVDDPELLKFPVAYLSEPGFWNPTEGEVEAMRTYLLKGGFLILDDFGGARDWANTERQFERVLPGFRWEELRGEHPIFQTFFEVNAPENLFNYRGAPIYFALFDENDPAKRVLVIANYNNDIGEFWEFADAGILPVAESNTAFQIGINYVIYAMSR